MHRQNEGLVIIKMRKPEFIEHIMRGETSETHHRVNYLEKTIVERHQNLWRGGGLREMGMLGCMSGNIFRAVVS